MTNEDRSKVFASILARAVDPKRREFKTVPLAIARPASWSRWAETGAFVLGISLLGWPLAMVVRSRLYQARQGRAFSSAPRVAGSAAQPPPALDPLLLGRIEIARIGISAMVREGDDEATLGVAVGHIPGTARPGERGNMALAGHRDSFFRALQGIRRHDSVRFVTAGSRYEYLVESTEVVAPEETRVLVSTGEPILTLITCYPFAWVGHAPRRFIVRARLVPAAVAASEVPRNRRKGR